MTRRTAVVVVLLAVLVGALLVDRGRDPQVAAVEPAVPGRAEFPLASAPGAPSSTWFCAGGSADEESFADHTVIIANPADAPVTLTFTAFPGTVAPPSTQPSDEPDAPADEGDDGDPGQQEGEGAGPAAPASVAPVERTAELAARSRLEVRLSQLVQAPVASALVESDAGGLVVEHQVRSIHGFDVKPCVTGAATTWHFAWGTTTVDAREVLVLFNPFPEDAIVEGTFSTDQGTRQPARFSGLVVPARSSLGVDLGDDVTRRAEVAATIRARAGRIVVDRIQRLSGSRGPRGLTVQSGVTRPQLTWAYPDGLTSETTGEAYVVYNPGDQAAEVEIEIIPHDPAAGAAIEPFSLSVPPGTHQVARVSADGRIPPGTAHAAVVRSENGVPVVAERVLFSSGTNRRGISVTTGSPVVADEWTFAAGATTDALDEWLVVLNLDPQILSELRVFALAGGKLLPVEGLQDFEVLGGQRVAIRLGERIRRPDLAIVVRATEPVVVERWLHAVGRGALGSSNAIGVPSSPGVSLPPDPLDAAVDVDLGDTGTTEPTDGDAPPTAPDDVELPEPDETIPLDGDDEPAASTTTSRPATTTTRRVTTTTRPGTTTSGVPPTAPG